MKIEPCRMPITERPRSADDVSTSAQADALVDELPDGVLVMTASGLLTSANKAFLEMVGRDKCEVIGKSIETIVAEEDMLQLVGVETMFREATRDASILFSASDGSPRRLLVCSAKS